MLSMGFVPSAFADAVKGTAYGWRSTRSSSSYQSPPSSMRSELAQTLASSTTLRRSSTPTVTVALACAYQVILCVHGGIGDHVTSIAQISHLPRPAKVDLSTRSVLTDLLWSDPTEVRSPAPYLD